MSDDISPQLFAALTADPLAQLLGIQIESIHPGRARATMTISASHLNAVGSGHGGATMALIDVVHAAVSNSHGTVAVAQEVHTEFLAPTAEGDLLVCDAVELQRTRRTAVYRIEVRTQPQPDRDAALVASALARVYRVGDPWVTAGSGTPFPAR